MSIEVISNTDTTKVQADAGQAPKASVDETKSASTAKAEDEITEVSETSEASDEVESQEAEESEDENEDDEAVKDDETKPKRNKAKNRIAKLRSRLSEKDQAIAARDREIELLRQSKGQNQNDTQDRDEAKPDSKSDEPDPDKFNSYPEYAKALAKWVAKEEASERKAAEQQTQLKSDYEKQTADHNKRISEFKKDKPDYDEKVKTFLEDYGDSTGDYRFAPALQRAFTNQSGPALMYELLNDPDELVRINGLSYDDALLELGEIKARLKKSSSESSQEKIQPKQTKAPPPPKPISSGKAGARKSIYDADLSQSEYEALRREQMRKNA